MGYAVFGCKLTIGLDNYQTLAYNKKYEALFENYHD